MKNEKLIGIAAEFFKNSSKRLELFSLWVVKEETSHHDGKVYQYASGYDVEWSRALGSYIFHQSSGGFFDPEISGIYSMSGEITVKEKPCTLVSGKARDRNRTRRLKKLPKGFDVAEGSNLLEWLESNAIESDCVYCSTCRDFYPTCNEWELCDHVWWCEKKLDWSTPSERCDCNDRSECEVTA